MTIYVYYILLCIICIVVIYIQGPKLLNNLTQKYLC